MKALLAVFAIAALAIAVSLPARAGSSTDERASRTLDLAERNLLDGLTCDNCGVRYSAAFVLGDLKSSKAVIPLMAILHNSDDETARMVAALSLCKIGDARGVYAVKRAATFDDSPRLRNIFAWYYNEYVKAGTFEPVSVAAQ